MENPFELVTASKLSAAEAKELWCDDKRLERVWGKESCFINGHRGTGKSMLFRVLQYDCQKLLYPDKEPDFLSVYFPVRDSELMTEEIDLFQEDSQRNILSESHFALLILKQLFLVLRANPSLVQSTDQSEFINLILGKVRTAFEFCTPDAIGMGTEFDDVITNMLDLLERERLRIVHYVCLRLYQQARFDGPLFLFDTFLGPLADFLHLKSNKTLYVLIDDGDDLPQSHTIVLNTWIARRNTAVAFKVSTMFGYKTYQTRGRSAIQHPHDFTQYEIATRYLSDPSENYIGLLRNITAKRLRTAKIDMDPESFFPEDEEQRLALARLSEVLVEEYRDKYEGRSIQDYVYRHLTSEYIKRSLRPGRSSHTYNYSGFQVIATLSSGMVRDFIICAQKMFDNASRTSLNPTYIPPEVQSTVVRQHADLVLAEVSNAKQKRMLSSSHEDWTKIGRLIEGLANIFKAKMLSNDSERRVFSFAFQDEPLAETERLLDLAISEGYLMKGFISRKEGTGRRILYVLTRRLAPAFNLDVSAYSGYLSITSSRVQRLLEHGAEKANDVPSDQLALFQDMEFLNDAPKEEQAQKPSWVFISPEEAGQ